VSVTDAMRNLDRAGDSLLQAGKDLQPYCENEQIPWHLHQVLCRVREELRDLEAAIGEHVVVEATDV
jgi:hypothetical protein